MQKRKAVKADVAMFDRKSLSKLIFPLVVEQLLAVTIGMADTVMVASVGEAAVSGISLVDSINILLINIFSALATGGAIISSQYLGKNDDESACTAAKQLVYAITAMSSVIMVLCLVARIPLLNLIFGKVEPLVMKNAQTYFWLSALSYPFLGIYNAGAALFRAMGNSKVSMFTSILMNVVNITGNAILIFGFNMGVAGAATATLVSRILGAVIMLVLLKNKNGRIHIERLFKPELKLYMIKNILRIGVPNGLEGGMFQVGKILVQGLIASFGTVAIAANAVANNVAMIAQIPGAAIGLALITVVGQCVGAGEYKQAQKYILKLTGVSYVTMGVLNVLLFICLKPAIAVFRLTTATSELAYTVMVFQRVFSLLFWSASFVVPNGLRAASDVKFTMTVSVLSMWIFRIGFSYLLAPYMGLLGVWVAMWIDWIVRIIFFAIRIKSGKWKAKAQISEAQE